MSQPSKTTYRIRNWSEYDAALKQRGSITFWVSEEAIANWIHPKKTGKRGASPLYTDVAIWRSQIRFAVRYNRDNKIPF
ncbi:transposase [Crocosphaera sp. Alani8]|uniref:transposase n=1 Tax=Crocosphaera sp. Alani8 TaxID=3038952 RepID=UPI00313B039B